MIGCGLSDVGDAEIENVNMTDSNYEHLELLKKLQQENEKLEEDLKAPPPSSLNKKFHSRQSSTSSLLSINSGASSGSSIYYNCSLEVSPSMPSAFIQELSTSNSNNKILKSKQIHSNSPNLSPSTTSVSENWDSWISLIGEWEQTLKSGAGTHRLSKLQQRAAELFRQTWSIPDSLRGLVWQLVSGAREENAASVILAPSAATSGTGCLKSSALLSTQHLSELLLINKKCDELYFDMSKSECNSKSTDSKVPLPVELSLCLEGSSVSAGSPLSTVCSNQDHHQDMPSSEKFVGSLETNGASKSADYKLLRQTDEQTSKSEKEQQIYETVGNLSTNLPETREKEQSDNTSHHHHCSNFSNIPQVPITTPLRYADLLAVPSPHEKTISRDISRTYPTHAKFKVSWGEGQESLFNMARAYSVYDKEVGYCQGSSFIIGLLLMHMPEEDAFGVLVRIMYAYNLRDLFKPTMEALGLKLFQLERLIHDNLPGLYSVFSNNGVQANMFASPWFLTLFATTLPLGLVCRTFDAFLCHSSEVVFRLGLSLLKLNQSCLLGLSMEDMVQFLQKDLGTKAEADPDLFFSTAFQFRINPKKMKKLEKEYTEIESQERAEQTEVCRLRNENRRLQAIVEKLEKETCLLADQLVFRQIQCAELTEETTALRHAAAASRTLMIHNRSDHSPKKMQNDPTNPGLDQCTAQDMPCGLQISLLSAELDSLREELIGCKLREAESNLSIKELQHQIHEIQKLWNRVNQSQSKSSDGEGHSMFFIGPFKSTPLSSEKSMQELEQALLSSQIKEANLLSGLADARLNLTSLEHKASSLQKRNVRLEKQLGNSNLEIGSLIRDCKALTELLMENEKVLNARTEKAESEKQELQMLLETFRKKVELGTKFTQSKPTAAVAGHSLTAVPLPSPGLKYDHTQQ